MRESVRAKLDEASRLMLDVRDLITSLRCDSYDALRFAAAFQEATTAVYRAYDAARELPEGP